MKRVLVIAYYFPPVNNMGSHRILRLVRHFHEFGWQPVVLTGATLGWRERDDNLLAKLPATVEVHRARGIDLTELWKRMSGGGTASSSAPQPLKSHGLTTWLNRWVMIPDKYFPWIGPASRYARGLAFDAIYSTSGPLSDHLVAARVAQRSGRPWVAEFRDLWTDSPYFAASQPTALHRALHARLERRIVSSAAAVVTLGKGIQSVFAKKHPSVTVRVSYNCFEPEDYPATMEPAGKFCVMYAGALYSSRSPETFLTGFARFVRANALTPAEAEFVWLGASPDLDVPAMVERLGLTGFVRMPGQVPHAEVMRQMCVATVLLAIQSPEDNVHVPGKLFEYIGAGRPILAVTQPCEIACIVETHGLGWVAAPVADAVGQRLDEAHRAWKAKGHAGLTTQAAGQFNAREVTRQLAALLDSLPASR